MASLPKTGTEVQDATWEVVNGQIQPQVIREGILKPKDFPGVQVDISGIWPD